MTFAKALFKSLPFSFAFFVFKPKKMAKQTNRTCVRAQKSKFSEVTDPAQGNSQTGSIQKRKFLGICCTHIIVYPKSSQTFFSLEISSQFTTRGYSVCWWLGTWEIDVWNSMFCVSISSAFDRKKKSKNEINGLIVDSVMTMLLSQ